LVNSVVAFTCRDVNIFHGIPGIAFLWFMSGGGGDIPGSGCYIIRNEAKSFKALS